MSLVVYNPLRFMTSEMSYQGSRMAPSIVSKPLPKHKCHLCLLIWCAGSFLLRQDSWG